MHNYLYNEFVIAVNCLLAFNWRNWPLQWWPFFAWIVFCSFGGFRWMLRLLLAMVNRRIGLCALTFTCLGKNCDYGKWANWVHHGQLGIQNVEIATIWNTAGIMPFDSWMWTRWRVAKLLWQVQAERTRTRYINSYWFSYSDAINPFIWFNALEWETKGTSHRQRCDSVDDVNETVSAFDIGNYFEIIKKKMNLFVYDNDD